MFHINVGKLLVIFREFYCNTHLFTVKILQKRNVPYIIILINKLTKCNR